MLQLLVENAVCFEQCCLQVLGCVEKFFEVVEVQFVPL